MATGELIRSDAGKGLKITLARVPTLADGKGGTLHVGFIGESGQVSKFHSIPSRGPPKSHAFTCV